MLRIAEDINCVLAVCFSTRMRRETFKDRCLHNQKYKMGFTGMSVKFDEDKNPCSKCRIGKKVHEIKQKEIKREELRAAGRKKKNWEARAAAKRMKIPRIPEPKGISFYTAKEFNEIKKHLQNRPPVKRHKRVPGSSKMAGESSY